MTVGEMKDLLHQFSEDTKICFESEGERLRVFNSLDTGEEIILFLDSTEVINE